SYAKGLAAVALGIALGAAATARMATRFQGFGATTIGPWTAWPAIGGPDADPYARLHAKLVDAIPFAPGEGADFAATADSAGAPLDGACAYRVEGGAIEARFWTLEATTSAGLPFATPSHRHAFSSRDLPRDSAGRFAIVVAARASPGVWLPVAAGGRFELRLRLYDTASATLDGLALPAIRKAGCP
ncbi:MAG: DUF1214 domain-containing protein, partial [Hyphomicrobiales bacterium]|nr:DUF1214 domain-containing protein [Hyphomicrobiales bacterium]